ncbi:hypothetical protein pdam_00019643 [Pocillopora damicornis]|uniref:Uncharacterized protein n=1 Tax=Pocillopora damicornis TaxID=46731 RepID=A0A3M6T801_POCDA|nr:hypothetical protein pdam_00019643 [Pocillopora damicornis]
MISSDLTGLKIPNNPSVVTVKRASSWLNVWKTWFETAKTIDNGIVKKGASELNKSLEKQKSSTLPGNSPIEKRAKQLRQCGIGKRPHKASSFTEEEEEVLWKAKI